jgi:hypothetical protein
MKVFRGLTIDIDRLTEQRGRLIVGSWNLAEMAPGRERGLPARQPSVAGSCVTWCRHASTGSMPSAVPGAVSIRQRHGMLRIRVVATGTTECHSMERVWRNW